MTFEDRINLLTERLSSWLDTATANLPNLVLALIVAGTFLAISRPASRGLSRAVKRVNASEAIVSLSSALARILVIVLGFVLACGVLGLNKTLFSLLAGAGVIGIALGFAFQDLASNLIAGIVMGFRKPFEIGDHVITGEHEGHVRAINLRNTLIRTFAGQIVVIPNKLVFENPLVNYTTERKRRIEVEVGVTYETDVQEASSIACDAVSELDMLEPDEEVQVIATGFGASSIDLSVRFWIPVDASFLRARHEGVAAVKRAFDEAGIEIPFPIRTLDLARAESSLREIVPERATA